MSGTAALKKISGGVTAAKGFKAASTAAGIKYKDRKDMAMIYSEAPCRSAGTFTTNVVKAAPVKWDKNQVTGGAAAHAVVINAGIANACTGEEGMGYCSQTADAAAAVLGIPAESVLVASTGVIGKQLPMDKIKAGKLETRVDIRSNDELGVLAEGLNNMTEQLQKHIEKVYISEIRQKEAQIKALTAQIQPHYLYNTLDAIRMSAITNDDHDTALMLESLSAQMRYLIGDARSLVTLKEELDSIRNYFIIIQIRYENAVQLEINGKNETLKCRIPRLTLQPIIENSVKYGISPRGEGSIAVYTEKKQEYLEITVLDDGVGMDGETLAYVNGVLKGTVIQERTEERRFSIGLKNIEDRIKLQFGDCYGIRLDSTPGLGTLVHVKLPVYYGEGEGD